MSVSLPLPDGVSREHAASVARHVASEIAAAGGWIPFSRFMELALYAPGLGYYVAGARKFGRDGDFVTAPEMTPLFSATVARQIGDVLAVTGGDVLELGAGSGRFAADALAELERLGAPPARYRILEPGAELRARQRATIGSAVPRLLARVEWLDSLPSSLDGVVFGNEVLDAVPCEIVRRDGGAWWRRGVVDAGVVDAGGGDRRLGSDDRNGNDADAASRFAWSDRPVDDPALAGLASARFPDVEPYTSELAPVAEGLVRTLVDRLRRGAVLLIDYGFPAAEYYHPERSSGTLACHYRHRVHDDPLRLVGLQDISAHVDFTAIAHAGVDAGATLAGYAPLAPFLVDLGMVERLSALTDRTGIGAGASAAAAASGVDRFRALSAVQKLLAPSEMGELFKAIAFTRGVDAPLRGFRSGDRSHRL